ncbi:MAG: glycosyltransferase family 2 protein [Candidatus Margulisiibacteriota bacterium]
MISIVIPAYNNLELLNANLPILLDSVAKTGLAYEIIVVDDASNKTLQINLPHTRVIRLSKNSGFACACNTGARQAKYSKILFLNTDVKVTSGFVEPLLEHFKDDRVFAVSPKILIPEEDNFNEAVTAARLRGSHLLLTLGSRKNFQQAQEILYACGAAMLVDKEKFLELGGFDELYSPFYAEDLDLSYQAWKQGYRVIFEPKSAVYHLHGQTIKSSKKQGFIRTVDIRNRYLFRWKNFSDPWLVFLMVLELFTLKLINPNPTEWAGYFKALAKIKDVLARRKELKKYAKLTDKEIFDKFKALG